MMNFRARTVSLILSIAVVGLPVCLLLEMWK